MNVDAHCREGIMFMERVGVVGLGRMGSALAQRFAMQDVAVSGWTRSGQSIEGIDCAPDLKSLVASSDTLVLSLFGNDAVGQVLDTLLTFDLQGKQVIETSTVTPDLLIDRHEQFADLGASVVDAPISGGPELVLAGACGVFIGGDGVAAAKAGASLSKITERILHVGPLGTGLVMKAINNGMVQAYFSGLYDLMPLAKRAGLPLETALRILSGGPAAMPLIADRIPKALGEDDEVGFALEAAFKDNDVFRQIVDSYGLDSPVLNSFNALKSEVVKADLLQQDPAKLISLAYRDGE
jgi:3-hydroxyisobutyrate dehydrogenase